ncbi:MAG: YcxB family protein [Oceanospirillaceae bacterium]
MKKAYSYSSTFTLNKAYLSECYEQSVVVDVSILKYKRAIISLLFGACLLVFHLVSDYIAFFVISLGVLEVFSTHYRKTWWLWRQMFGKSYNSEVTVLVNEVGINNSSKHVNETVEWQSITAIDKTNLGFIIHYSKGTSYLSKSCLDEHAVECIDSQAKTVLG